MKKIILSLTTAIFAVGVVCAQTTQKDWYNSSYEKDGVYGAEINKVYEFMGKKKAKHNPVVAIIGAGVDIEHEVLAKNLWVNKKEKADGIDNDGNGLVDDINGWNFIGHKDGGCMGKLGLMGDREWLRLKDKYGKVIFDGKKYFTYENGKRVVLTTPIDEEEYRYFRNLNNESQMASSYAGWAFGHYAQELAVELFRDMKLKFPDKKKYELADFESTDDMQARASRDSLFGLGYSIIHMHAQMMRNYTKNDSTYDYMAYVEESQVKGGQLNFVWKNYEKALAQFPVGAREKMVGDTGSDIDNRAYGNNMLLTANSAGGTMISTIIAGVRGVDGRNNPICPNAQIMPLIIVDQAGEPYLKDVALAIRYAVDHGADVICMGMPATLYPTHQRGWVEEAMRYAEEKGVLIIVNTQEMSINMDNLAYYPNRFMTSGKEFTNVMTVSPSDRRGNPMLKSNFGAKSVDLYAPGEALLAGYIGDTYKVGTGPILSMAVTAGVAALIKSYYPQLTGTQIRTLLNENVTSREGAEVEKMVVKKRDMVQDMFLFEDLCLSKGILNAFKAVQAADKMK